MKKLYKCAFAVLALTFSITVSAQLIPGVLVLNEGNFGVDNAGISFIGGGQSYADLFADVNGPTPLGNTAQSMAFDGDKAYVVLNGSNDLKVLNRQTLSLSAIMQNGLSNPRHIVIDNGNAYVTCWADAGNPNDDYVAVIHLLSLSITQNIPAPEGVERIIKSGDQLYVAHQGGYGFGNTVSVINIATNAITATINTGDVPNSIIAQDGVLYVLCGGKPSWSGSETAGKLMKFNLSDNSLISEISFEGHPSNLEIYGDYLIFSIDTDVYKITLNDTALPENPIFSVEEVGVYGIYGMDLIGDKIYVADAGDYVAPGKALVYSVNGDFEASYAVGRLPNGFYAGEIQLLATENQNAIAAVSVYPNPTADRFFMNTDQQAAIRMYDISGRLVKTTTYKTSGIDVSDLNSGIYVVEITINDQKSIKRLSVK